MPINYPVYLISTLRSYGTYVIEGYVYEVTSGMLGVIWREGGGSKYYISESSYIGIPVKVTENAVISTIYPSGKVKYVDDVAYDYYVYGNKRIANGVCTDFEGLSNTYCSFTVAGTPVTAYSSTSQYLNTTTNLVGRYYRNGNVSAVGSSAYIDIELATIRGWESNTFYGIYTPVAGSVVTGTWWIGYESYSYGAGEFVAIPNSTFWFENDYQDALTSLYLWFDELDSYEWIISPILHTKSSTLGYWHSATIVGTYTRTYTGPLPAPTPTTYVLQSPTYTNTTTRLNTYISETPILVTHDF